MTKQLLIQKIALSYLQLPLHSKIQLAKEMGYWEPNDIRLSDTDLGTKLFKTATERGERTKLLEAISSYL